MSDQPTAVEPELRELWGSMHHAYELRVPGGQRDGAALRIMADHLDSVKRGLLDVVTSHWDQDTDEIVYLLHYSVTPEWTS